MEESGRSSKRRKLDTPEPKSTSKGTTPITYSKKKQEKKGPLAAAIVNGQASENLRPSSSQSSAKAREDWKIAKAARTAAARKTTMRETDIYDDIDGAHPPPLRQIASVPRRKVLPDPLRNQRQEAQSSPLKNPATLGLFKQFQKKKTFEDEIKELERKAREEVKDDDSQSEDDETPKARVSRRRSGRHERDEEIEDSEPERVVVRPNQRTEQHDSVSTPTKANTRPQQASRTVAKPESAGPGPPVQHAMSTPMKDKLQKAAAVRPKETTIPPEQLQKIQRLVLEQLTGRRPIPLTHLADEHAKVSQLISQTITAGESNSMLLIGSRGSGKSALLNQVLREQTLEHADDFHVVRLNGFIHTDDKIALREIWRQLGREMDLPEDDGPTSKNYADTMAQLLALLSHPAEVGLEQEGHVTKSVIFILDEFDLFASHPRQTLLYNLFDIAQSRKAPIAVLGCTTRVDVAESLEKRVKSRFSHRSVHLSPAKTYPAFVETCQATLSLSPSPPETPDADLAAALPPWNHVVAATLAHPTLQHHLRTLYHTTKSPADFTTALLLPLASPLPTTTTTLIDHLTASLPPPPDSKLHLLPSLPTLALALLVCAARLHALHDTDLVTFDLAYEEYRGLASKARLQHAAAASGQQRISGKAVARRAWEALVEAGLVLVEGRGVRVDVGLEEIGRCEGGGGGGGVELAGWGKWCREI
ncbi:Origin recognition complex subunit 4 [Teratosphaeria destructans]|uniref:Origin recognition complex subunit 4 n=1 Tax=Teratosphaeria destructans TaxID=418781 RepID=A0A9W7SMG9_9PEZI|nr:Origin recognition complex subunit 4 [Teratosphaeria destructans]